MKLKDAFVALGFAALILCFSFLSGSGGIGKVDDQYITNLKAFGFEIAGNDATKDSHTWIDRWFFDQPPPYKYRVLGKLPIYITYKLVNMVGVEHVVAFYGSYLLWVFLFVFLYFFVSIEFISTVIDDARLQSNNSMNCPVRLIAYLLLLMSPPVLFAFKFPVHGSPNEFLGYALIAFGMLSLYRKRLFVFTGIAVVSIACRETCLVILLPLLFHRDVGLYRKGVVFLVSGAAFLLYRILMGGGYNPFPDAAINYLFPLESLGFLIMSFGAIWFLGFAGWYCLGRMQCGSFCMALKRSFIPSLILLLLVNVFLARIREIRISYILFIYLVPFSIVFIFENISSIKSIVFDKYYVLYLLVCGVICFGMYVFLMPSSLDDFIVKFKLLNSLYGGFGGGWISILMFHVFALLAVLPLTLVVSRYRKKCES